MSRPILLYRPHSTCPLSASRPFFVRLAPTRHLAMLYEGSELHAYGRTKAEAALHLQQKIDAIYDQVLYRFPETRQRHLFATIGKPKRPKWPLIDAYVEVNGVQKRLWVRYVENPAEHAVPRTQRESA